MMPITVCCVLRTGGDFDAEYVERLYAGVRDNWLGSLDFLCLTNSGPLGIAGVRQQELTGDWPGYWCKMGLYHKSVKGTLLFFDLDTMIIGSLSAIQCERQLSILTSFRKKRRNTICNSSVMVLPEAVRPMIWKAWERHPERWMAHYIYPARGSVRQAGDEGLTVDTWNAHRVKWFGLQQSYPQQFASYGKYVRNEIDRSAARVVVFFRDPRPRAINWTLPPAVAGAVA